MTTSPSTQRRIVVLAWVMAGVGTVFGQLHALSRIASHPEDLEYPLTRAWAVPAMDLFSPLLDWGDPYFVYWTYGKVWLPVFAAFTTAAWLVYRHRRPAGFERWTWRFALTGYAVATLSVLGEYYTPWTDEAFVFVALPGLLLTALASTLLGVTLLVKRFRPRLTAFLLVGFIPLVIGITEVTSMGSAVLPLAWGWAYAAHRVVRAQHPGTSYLPAPMATTTYDVPRASRG
jgi:hypothetical protein